MTTASAVPVQNNMRGIATMLLGICLFAGEAVGKLVASTYPPAEILLLRSIAPLLLLLPFLPRPAIARGVVPQGIAWHLARAALSTAEVACFFAAVGCLPLADALTFYQAGPVYVTVLSALLLRERVGAARWAAVLAGFAWVMITLNPSTQSFGSASLIALAGSLAYAALMVLTRTMRRSTEPVLIAWQLAGALAFGAAAFWAGLVPSGCVSLPPRDLLLLCGNLCVTRSLRLAGASVVVPYQYTIMVWAVLNGWLFFGKVPHASTLAGAVLIWRRPVHGCA